MKTIVYFVIVFSVTALAQTSTQIVSPLGLGGDYSTRTPFLVFSSEAPSMRYQQVYSSSDFQRRGNLPWRITELSFTAGLGGIDFDVPNVQIHLSTTQRQPDGLSTMFSENIGPDSTIVYSGPLRLSAPSTFEFNLDITLQQAFIYNAAAGNLLLEVKNFQTIPSPGVGLGFLAARTPGDSVSSARAADVNSSTAFLDTGGLRTEFTATAVPEPGSVVLFLFGTGLVGLLGWQKQRQRLGRRWPKPEREAV